MFELPIEKQKFVAIKSTSNIFNSTFLLQIEIIEQTPKVYAEKKATVSAQTTTKEVSDTKAVADPTSYVGHSNCSD